MNQKIIYFAGAIRGDRTTLSSMAEIVRFVKDLGFPVLTEHVVADDPMQAHASKMGKTKDTLTVEDIEKQDIGWLDGATHVIAEISGASTGTGREIEYARTKGSLGKVPAKILCLYHNEREPHASALIRGMTNDRYPNVFIERYKNTEEAKNLVKKFIENN